ncbi:MAG: MaoC family dehydratase, partial [Nevskiales bacterium]
RLPSALPAYAKALRARGRLAEGQTIPRIEARVSGVMADPARLRDYRTICGFADSDKLPVSFPQVLGFPLQMAALTHEKFPLRLLGLVHVRNLITQYRPLDAREPLDFLTWVEGHRPVHNGIEFDIVTEARDSSGALVWKSLASTLSRGKGSGQKPAKKPVAAHQVEFGRYASWDVPENIGRRYGLNAGDVNPIHLTALSARLFGFKRAIAHGMWTMARCTAELGDELPKGAFSLSVAFKLPVFLPSSVLMKYGPAATGIEFALLSEDGEKTHLAGQVMPAS